MLDSSRKSRWSFWIAVMILSVVAYAMFAVTAQGRIDAGAPEQATTIGWVAFAYTVVIGLVVAKARPRKSLK